MRRHGFVGKNMEPMEVYANIKKFLSQEGFTLGPEDIREGFWDLHARKSSLERIALGKVRDVDVVVAGTKGKFEVQLHAGVWGRDLAIPAVEGIATFGVATAADLHSAHQFEERMWEKIVHGIDPSLKICSLDGLLFKTDQELSEHAKLHEQQNLSGQANAMNSMAMMGMVGMMGMGMWGMGMMGPGLWI